MGINTVITGGTSGIGKAIILKLLNESRDPSDRFFVNYGHRDKAAGELLRSVGIEDRDKIHIVKADMSAYEGVDILFNRVSGIADRVDRLILNTGIGSYEPFDKYTAEMWDKVMMTNVSVPAFTVKAFKPMMREKGCILFMGSHAGQEPYSTSLVYAVSKAALMFMAKSLVKVFDGQGVRVNAVAPGFIETGWQVGRSEESRERINRKIGVHRFGEADEVAELCYEILTNEYLNGSIYDIHGGYNYF